MKEKKPLIITVIAVLVIALIVVGFFVLKSHHSPIKSLERIFSLRADMKLQEYYNSFDLSGVDKNVFTSLDTFLEMSSEKGWGKIDNFEIEKKEDLTFTVKYNDIIEEITLVPQEEKSLLFFDTYKIDITSMLSRTMYVSVRIDAELYIDGELMDRKYISDTEYYDNYIFSGVFDKKYDVKVLTEYTEPYSTTIRPLETPHVLRDLKLTEEAERAIYDLSSNFVQRFYYAMQDAEGFDAISQYITENKEKRLEIQKYYDDLSRLFTRGEEVDGLIDVCFLENITTVGYPNENTAKQNVYPATTTVRYSFNYLEYDEQIDEYIHHSDVFDESTFTIYCAFENGKWVVYGVDDILINMYY